MVNIGVVHVTMNDSSVCVRVAMGFLRYLIWAMLMLVMRVVHVPMCMVFDFVEMKMLVLFCNA